MALIKTLLNKTPKIGEGTFLAETATIIGDVTIGKHSSIWYNAVIRGDVNSIKIGDETNIQDNVTVHCTHDRTVTTIGNNVTIGHNAVIHGCTIADDVLVGMGAIIMDYCKVNENSVVAAGAVVTKGTVINSGEIWAGVPAVKIKTVAVPLLEQEIHKASLNYLNYVKWYE